MIKQKASTKSIEVTGIWYLSLSGGKLTIIFSNITKTHAPR